MVDFGEIKVPKRLFSSYAKLNRQIYHEVLDLSESLKGRKIAHVNSTETGGGVAEILVSQVALEQALDIESHWYVIHPPDDFFVITKKIHNLLQGNNDYFSEHDKDYYHSLSKSIGDVMDSFLDKVGVELVIIHDPQPLLAGSYSLSATVPKILRLHIDLSNPNKQVMDFLRSFIETFDKVVISRDDYKPDWLLEEKTAVIYPAIDPFSAKNKEMTDDEAWEILNDFGIDRKKPLICQVSRFDHFKDPVGVIKAYEIAKKEIDNLQLVLIGLIEAKDDPEAIHLLKVVHGHAKDNPNIHIISDPKELKGFTNSQFVNALQKASDIVLQKSIKEGFGLTVAEAMYKGKAVIGGNVGGIKLQIENSKNGYLVSSIEETAHVIVRLIRDDKLREKIGRHAKATIKEKFLIPRCLSDNFKIYNELLNE